MTGGSTDTLPRPTDARQQEGGITVASAPTAPMERRFPSGRDPGRASSRACRERLSQEIKGRGHRGRPNGRAVPRQVEFPHRDRVIGRDIDPAHRLAICRIGARDPGGRHREIRTDDARRPERHGNGDLGVDRPAGREQVSRHPEVRDALLGLQRKVGAQGGVVLEGRDIGTVVFPDADVKFFLTASDEERAGRRLKELLVKGTTTTLDEVLSEMRERDRRDSMRATAPLKQARDAILVDSTTMTLEQVVDVMQAAVLGKRKSSGF